MMSQANGGASTGAPGTQAATNPAMNVAGLGDQAAAGL